ncbi:MAG: NAD-dependent deacylase [Bacteroidota bacterium]|nr:NAD-dependent deacylase [Bacteroidota bacterium]
MSIDQKTLINAANILRSSRFTTAHTGAGISVESGIPPFRGEGGLWDRYDSRLLEIDYFMENPAKSWKTIKEIFYDHFGKAKPNPAHLVLAEMERKGMLGRIITQNIDNLHQKAGSHNVFEFHGNSQRLICLHCGKTYDVDEISLDHLPPKCSHCGGLLKPDFVFFGEQIPSEPLNAAYEATKISDVILIIGTTGEVMPANQIPFLAKNNGAQIIEINPKESHFTNTITDIYLEGKAGETMEQLGKILFPASLDNDHDSVNQNLKIHGQ